MRERFAREARFAARLQHPNIVTIYDVGEHDGQPFIAMEYIPGETMARADPRRAPLVHSSASSQLVDELCGGLAFAHKHGIVHRDIKPANLMVSRERHRQDPRLRHRRATARVGHDAGRHAHRHAELHVAGAGARRAVDHRSDIFAVGLVLYELLGVPTGLPGRDARHPHLQIVHGSAEPLACSCPSWTRSCAG